MSVTYKSTNWMRKSAIWMKEPITQKKKLLIKLRFIKELNKSIGSELLSESYKNIGMLLKTNTIDSKK